jgi:outer membrane beta-barrel protein
MMKRIALPFLFALTVALPVALPAVAHAQRRSPLADAPAIRKRVELRHTRLEFGVGAGSTINQTFYHGLLVNGHLGFHFNDWLSVAGIGAFNVTSLATGFHDELEGSLRGEHEATDFRAPSAVTANSSLNKISAIFGGQIEGTPFAGKFAALGALFANYDFYLFAGGVGVNLAAVNSNPAAACTGSHSGEDRGCTVTGLKVGGTFGAGFHTFFNNFLALNVELRDVLIKDNPAGRDVNGDKGSDNNDLTWTSHLMATIGLAVYLPSTADISP